MNTNTCKVEIRADGSVGAKMVGWYDPGQLAQTACSVVVSSVFGRHADFRLMEAIAKPSQVSISDETGSEPLWIDYVADVGDGWNSTYAVAYTIAQQTLTLADSSGATHETHRGRILVFGGDGVYPVASRSVYKEKLIAPYETAFGDGGNSPPDVFAIPGNHDWYDSLTSFMRTFCSERFFGGWQTKQSTSYFAAKLPHGWWLVGVDIQLESDVDEPQVKFLHTVAQQMAPQDRVILFVAEPHWIASHIYGEKDADYNENNLKFIETIIFRNRIAAFIAGDLHHYRRHQSPSGVQKITAGGGGAFLHPTHGSNVDMLAENFALEAAYPPAKTSWALCFKNFLFLRLNPTFGVVTALLYLLTGWATNLNLGDVAWPDIKTALHLAVQATLNQPLAAFWVTLTFCSFYLFTDTHSRYYRYIAGTAHALAHVLAMFAIGWASARYIKTETAYEFGTIPHRLISGAALFVGGWLAGSVILGLYLFISLNLCKRHSNEAFSSLKIQDWKNFLRMKIDTDGTLTIYPVGLRKVPRRWKLRGNETTASLVVPKHAEELQPELIEAPITLRKI